MIYYDLLSQFAIITIGQRRVLFLSVDKHGKGSESFVVCCGVKAVKVKRDKEYKKQPNKAPHPHTRKKTDMRYISRVFLYFTFSFLCLLPSFISANRFA